MDDQGRIERMIDGRINRDVWKGEERSEGIKGGIEMDGERDTS